MGYENLEPYFNIFLHRAGVIPSSSVPRRAHQTDLAYNVSHKYLLDTHDVSHETEQAFSPCSLEFWALKQRTP